jgi:hypothetical protein
MNVPAGSTLRMVNRTGHQAKLKLGGAAQGTVPNSGSTRVVFRRGVTSVRLSPTCASGNEADPLVVTAVSTSPVTMPDPIPAPSEPAAAQVTPSASTATPGGAGHSDTVSPAANPQRPVTASAPGGVRGTTWRPPGGIAAAPGTAAMPKGDAAARLKIKILKGTDPSAAELSALPPSEMDALLPGVPMNGVSGPPPASAAVPPADVATVEPVSAMESIPDSRPIGLLALTAMVCMLGVAAGIIRAIVSQRASRTKIA